MPGTTEALLKLQEVQLEISELRQEEGGREQRIALHRRELAKIEARLAQIDAQIRDVKSQASLAELDVKSREQNISKHREALKQTRTNKEYNAILTSLNMEEVDKGKAEARALELMSQVDQLVAQRGTIDAERQQVQDRIRHVEEALRAYLEKTAPRRQELSARLAQASEGIPPQSLQTFFRVADRHEGQAMAPVIRIHPKRDEHCCGGCNMKVTLEVINALRGRDDLQFCASCGRILYPA